MRLTILVSAATLAHATGLQLLAQEGSRLQGEITNIDLTTGRLTIKHGPIPALGMDQPDGTDDFQVGDAIMLNAVRRGERLTFTAARVDGRLVITAIVPSKP